MKRQPAHEERAYRRARRRAKEVSDLDYETVAADLARRDTLDSTRDIDPLSEAPDAVLIDTTGQPCRTRRSGGLGLRPVRSYDTAGEVQMAYDLRGRVADEVRRVFEDIVGDGLAGRLLDPG